MSVDCGCRPVLQAMALVLVFIVSCSGDRPDRVLKSDRSRVSAVKTSVRSILFQSDRDGDFEIFSMRPDGSSLHQLTHNVVDDQYPSWSPDGRSILFESTQSGVRQVVTMRADGTDRRQLTHEAEDSCSPSWSADGKTIYFDHRVNDRWVMYRMDAAGGTPEPYLSLGDRCDTILSSWAADGSAMVFTSNREGIWHIYLQDATSGAIVQLTSDKGGCRPQWSPHSRLIAYVSPQRDGRGDIWIMDRAGKGARCLTSSDNFDYYPTWSADGMKIVYATAPDKNRGPWNIMLLSIAGGEPLSLTTNEWRDKYPHWY